MPVKDDNSKVSFDPKKQVPAKKGKVKPVETAHVPVQKNTAELEEEDSMGITGVLSFKVPTEGEDQDKHNDDSPTTSSAYRA